MIRPWTDADDHALRDAAATGQSPTAVAASIGRSRNSCMGRAHRLGIRFKRAPRDASVVTGPKHDKARLAAFAEALADHGTIIAAAASIGISHQRGSQLFARIRSDIDSAQKAVGYGEWCR